MARALTTSDVAGMSAIEHPVPIRRWYRRGHAISISASLVMAVAIGVFFLAGAGWTPPAPWHERADFTVTWVLLTYIWVQMGSLLLVGAGTKHQMWLDALTSIVPLFVIFYVILQYLSGYIALSPFQVRTAWVTAYAMLLDVVVDLGVSVLLSRQVVEMGGGGVA